MKLRTLFAVAALGAALGFASFAFGQSQDERMVRAAYVYHLSQFVTWPIVRQEIVVAYIGDVAGGEQLRQMLSSHAGSSQNIRVVLSPTDEDLDKCSIVYIAAVDPERTRTLLERVHKRLILTIGDSEQFTTIGGMIALVHTGDQIHMKVNLDAVKDAGLQISSRVLSMAEVVHAGKAASN